MRDVEGDEGCGDRVVEAHSVTRVVAPVNKPIFIVD